MGNFSDDTVQQIWEKAKVVEKYNPNLWRKDFAGAWIRRDYYGIRNKYGWEIDHKRPAAAGGSNRIENLCPLHWQNNVAKGDAYPSFQTCLTSEGNVNIERILSWRWRSRN